MTTTAATTASTTGTTAGSATSANTGSGASLASLSSNFTTFLNLLLTQLKNQDPTSPMDTNQFTTELVQFSQVEQQISTNSSLNALIQATNAGQVIQGTSLVGKSVTAQSAQVPLQNGQATLGFTMPSDGTAAITLTNAAGVVVDTVRAQASAGQHQWTWDGSTTNGGGAPDGAYKATITATDANGQTSTLPFTVTGTATGVSQSNGAPQLMLGSVGVPFSAVQSVGN